MLASVTLFITIFVNVIASAHSEEFNEDLNEKYIDSVQDQWKQYRNLVKDGFMYNDSFIVINDYEDILDNENNDLNYIVSEDVIDNDSAAIGDIPKLGFESTLMGMVSALQEIQSKGDQMMNAINDQKNVLVKLRTEVYNSYTGQGVPEKMFIFNIGKKGKFSWTSCTVHAHLLNYASKNSLMFFFFFCE